MGKPYSTISEFRENVSIGTASNISNPVVTSRIIQADLKIETDLSTLF